ncbi:MAG: hypothetical protein K2X52_15960 [Mycobacteriaceae bacterium]|nr:hypothetical protein [Mycobacteriaceae bacterium]
MKTHSAGTPRLEDINEAAALDLKASRTPDAEEAEGLRWCANNLRNPITDWPVEDSPRTSYNEWHCVVEEIDDLHAYRPADDTMIRLPVRVAYQGDPQIEIGPLDLSMKDVSVLRRAIAAYDRLVAERRQGKPMKVLYESPSIEPNEDGSIVNLKAHRNSVSWLRARLKR